MKTVNPVSDDMFERARKAFFGIAETSPKDEKDTRFDPAPERVEVGKHIREEVKA
jgi:hypothetical protein